MDIALVLIGSLLTFIGLVMMIINFVRKKPIKKYGIALTLGMIIVVAGGFMVNEKIEDDLASAKETTKKQFEEDVDNIKESLDDKAKEIEDKKKEESEKKKAKGEVEIDPSIPEREFTIGKSDNNFLDVTDSKPREVINDVTEKWRMIKLSESIDTTKHLLSYNKLYMQEDSTAPHIIVNFTYKTTTIINDFGSYLSVRVHEYVDEEELDAKKLGNGLILSEYNIYKDNGDIVDFEKVVGQENK